MWKLYARYVGGEWTGTVMYPMSFNIRDSYNDLDFYLKAINSGVPSKLYKDELYKQIAEVVIDDSQLLQEITQQITAFEPHVMYNPNTGESVVASNEQEHIALADTGYVHEQPIEEGTNNDAST
jgi:hypothetical protein